MGIDSKDRDRLEKLLNMLGSPNEGEIGNAGRMIKKMADRYNVTPAKLCLGNPKNPDDDIPFGGSYGTGFGARGFSSWAREEARRQAEEDAIRREEAQRKRNEEYHRQREEELRRAGERAAREAAKKAARSRRYFPGSYFGMLGRLKMIYDNQFEGLETYELDFIETVLGSCKADRMMTRTQLHMAKAIVKENEQADPLV